MRRIILALLLAFSFTGYAQIPEVASGSIQHFEKFQSKFVEPRNIDVWLPESYDANKKYAVLYMHDGQMLYDANKTWNKQEWKVDEVVSNLMKEKKIRDCIVVGIWNAGAYRHTDYFPEKAANYLSDERKHQLTDSLMGKMMADEYLQFITQELKPFIDKTFSVKTGFKNTFIAGSSMGGLISMYAICEYPKVFSGAACISTHWPGDTRFHDDSIPNAIISYLKDHLPSHKNHKIYFDHGDKTLDSLYAPYQKRVDEIMKEKGYDKYHWMTRVYPNENHSEISWSKRLHIPIAFLLQK